MPQKQGSKRNFKFTGGLNTEAGYLAPQPGTWADGLNVIPSVDGKLSRRQSLRTEDEHDVSTYTAANTAVWAFSVGEWTAANGDGNLNYAVWQMGSTVTFHLNVDGNFGETYFDTIDLSAYQVASTPLAAQYCPCSYTSGVGKLFITSQAIEPLMVTLSDDGLSVEVTEINIEVRDFIGVDDELILGDLVRTRPSTLSAAHQYNLYNQGWNSGYVGYFVSGGIIYAIPPNTNGPTSGAGVYPSNVDQQAWGTNGLIDHVGNSSWYYGGVDLQYYLVGNARAPRGRFIISPFGNNREAVSSIVGLPAASVVYTRPTTIAFHAGRAWYAGVSDKVIGSWVMFSQTGQDEGVFGQCYQADSPTVTVEPGQVINGSLDVSGFVAGVIVDSDGGVISIHDAGTIVKLVSLQNAMIVIADNGLWQITGDSGGTFKATAYSVSKITSIGCVSAESVVVVNDRVFYWATNGIMQVSLPQTSVAGTLVAESVSDNSIASYYTDISNLSKRYAAGIYHPDEKKIYWAFDDTPNGSTNKWSKNRVLVLDLRLGCWYPFKFEDSAFATPDIAHVLGLGTTRPISAGTNLELEVLRTADQVVDTGINNVVVSLDTLQDTGRILKFYCVIPIDGLSVMGLSRADLVYQGASTHPDIRYRDWHKQGDIDGDTDTPWSGDQGTIMDAYVESQWEEDGLGADKRMDVTYITVFQEKTEEGIGSYDIEEGSEMKIRNSGGTLMQSRWDFTDTDTSGKWSAYTPVYRHLRNIPNSQQASSSYDTGAALVITKNKIRGTGRALKLRFQAEEDKAMVLLGWAESVQGNTVE